MYFKNVSYSFILLCLCCMLQPNNAQGDLVVKTDKGSIRGIKQKDYKGGLINSFIGIPYAKPPLGELRFKDPVPADPWQGVLNTTHKRPSCVQVDGGIEDCLFLNVYTPELPNGTYNPKLPVIYYVHEGSFLFSDVPYGPAFLTPKGVVLVECSFRLSVFGFLSFENTSLGVPGNAGLKDQNLGMKWVQKNIALFGGDPNNVTLLGASAGGAAVNLHVLSPLSQGLFHRAISTSASATCPWVLVPRLYKTLSSVLGFESNDPAAILNFLRYNTSSSDLLTAEYVVYNKYYSPVALGALNAFTPVLETPHANAFMTEHPEKILFGGNYKKVDYLIGVCKDEGWYWDGTRPGFIQPNFTSPEDLIPDDLFIQKGTNRSKTIGDKIQKFYYQNEKPSYSNYDKYGKYIGDMLFSYKVYNVSKHLAQYANVYFYQFSYYTFLNPSPTEVTGLSLHIAERNYTFADPDNIPNLPPGSDAAIGVHRITTLWTNFVKTGNPNPRTPDPLLNVTWAPLNPNNFSFLHIKPQLEIGKIPFDDRLTFWEQLYKDVFSGVL